VKISVKSIEAEVILAALDNEHDRFGSLRLEAKVLARRLFRLFPQFKVDPDLQGFWLAIRKE
jgi:hypothetical protein